MKIVLSKNSPSMTEINLGSPAAAINVFPLEQIIKVECRRDIIMGNYDSRSPRDHSMSELIETYQAPLCVSFVSEF